MDDVRGVLRMYVPPSVILRIDTYHLALRSTKYEVRSSTPPAMYTSALPFFSLSLAPPLLNLEPCLNA